MVLNLLIGLVVISLAVSVCALFMAFRLREVCDRIYRHVSLQTEGGLNGSRGPRVTIARDYEMPDALEAAMERRAQKPPMA